MSAHDWIKRQRVIDSQKDMLARKCEVTVDLLAEADGLLSLVAERYHTTAIPDEVRRQMLTVSGRLRTIYSARTSEER